MRNIVLRMAVTIKELAALPVGSKIMTRKYRVLELDQIEAVTTRSDAGERYWIEPGTLQPLAPDETWLPAVVLVVPEWGHE